MKKLIAALILLPLSLYALEVDRKEITPGKDSVAIEFINYTGPQTVISTAAEIRAIGSNLASSLTPAITAKKTQTAGDAQRYSIIHAIDPSITTGFDADIIILGAQAGVDHIDNIRRIISSYLTTAYGYSEKDSATLANFITVYNAINRGKLSVIKERYKPVVLGYLRQDSVGLSLRYDEWPGKTQILIPLTEARLSGTISSIDTTTLTENSVVQKMKEDQGKGIDTRKDMVDLKERETDAATDRAAKAQAEAAKTRTEESAQKKEVTAAEKQAADAQAKAIEERKKAEVQPENQAQQESAAQAEKDANAKKEELAVKKESLAETQEKRAEKESQAEKDQSLADTKQAEVRIERKEIASDIQKEIDERKKEDLASAASTLLNADPAFALKISDTKDLLCELVLINLNDGAVMKTSPINSIRGRTIFDTGSALIAVAGKKGGQAAIRLVLIDPKTLEMIKQGEDSIAETSMLVQNNNDYYAVIENNSNSYVIGRFDKELNAKAKSAVEVQSATAIIVTPKGLLVQNKDGSIALLRATDLTVQSK